MLVIVALLLLLGPVRSFLGLSSRRSLGRRGQELHMGPFNPFTARNKNTRVRWFENELSKFYTYVESQPLLTHEQELQYGKALNMWMRVLNLRDKLHEDRQANMTLSLLPPRRPTPSSASTPSTLFELPVGVDGDGSPDFVAAMTGGDELNGSLKRPDISTAANSEMIVDGSTSSTDLTQDMPLLEAYENEIIECEISNDDLAEEVGCAPKTLEKIQRCAEIARTRLVNSNLKLVLAIVSRYRTSGIPNAELIAEGTRGLSRAVDRYDYSKGFRFATYATWYVHQAVSEYVRWRKHPAKMPSRYLLLQRRVKEFANTFKEERQRSPEVKEIAAALDQSEFDVIKVLTMQTYPLLLNAPLNSIRTSSKGEGMRERTLEDVVASKAKNPNTRSGSTDLRNDMEKLMQVNLNDVERDVLRLRLGLDDGRAKAVKEVGRRFKISWKQVRSVEREALSKLLGSDEVKEFVANYEAQPQSSSV